MEVDTARGRQHLPISLCSVGMQGWVPTGPAAPPGPSCGFPFPQAGFGHSAAMGWLGSFSQALPITEPLLFSPPSSCKLLRSWVLFFCWMMYSITSNNKKIACSSLCCSVPPLAAYIAPVLLNAHPS